MAVAAHRRATIPLDTERGNDPPRDRIEDPERGF
jgi:hypothetical protein